MQSVISLYKSKSIIPLVAGPGWTDGNNGNPSQLTAYQQTLNSYNAYSHSDAASAGVYQSDICDQTHNSLNAALAVYGSSYTIGEHYTPNGAITVAYEDVKSLGATGTIGNVNVDMTAGTATASSGHTVVSYSKGTVVLDSTTYPFCYNYDPNEYSGTTGIASMLPYVPFSSDLNRFILTVTNLGASSANVTWGTQTQSFTSAQLAAGVNLPASYTSTPFDSTFAQVMAAVVSKEQFETYEVKYTGNYYGNDNGGNIDGNMVAVQSQLDTGVRALIVPRAPLHYYCTDGFIDRGGSHHRWDDDGLPLYWSVFLFSTDCSKWSDELRGHGSSTWAFPLVTRARFPGRPRQRALPLLPSPLRIPMARVLQQRSLSTYKRRYPIRLP